MNNDENKILVRIVLPMSGIAHDVKLLPILKIRDVVPTLIQIFSQLHKDSLLLNNQPLLCLSETGEPLTDPDATIEECGIRDADILYLV